PATKADEETPGTVGRGGSEGQAGAPRRTPGRGGAPQLVEPLRRAGTAYFHHLPRMKLLIYAPAARMGGARAHLLGLVPELAAIAPDDEVLLVAQPDLIEDLSDLPPGWTLRAE